MCNVEYEGRGNKYCGSECKTKAQNISSTKYQARGRKYRSGICRTCGGKSEKIGGYKCAECRVYKEVTPNIKKMFGNLCFNCGWDLGSCDVHHINGRKVADSEGLWNLTILCPNCHRLAHEGKIGKERIESAQTVKDQNDGYVKVEKNDDLDSDKYGERITPIASY